MCTDFNYAGIAEVTIPLGVWATVCHLLRDDYVRKSNDVRDYTAMISGQEQTSPQAMAKHSRLVRDLVEAEAAFHAFTEHDAEMITEGVSATCARLVKDGVLTPVAGVSTKKGDPYRLGKWATGVR